MERGVGAKLERIFCAPRTKVYFSFSCLDFLLGTGCSEGGDACRFGSCFLLWCFVVCVTSCLSCVTMVMSELVAATCQNGEGVEFQVDGGFVERPFGTMEGVPVP